MRHDIWGKALTTNKLKNKQKTETKRHDIWGKA
jgi:hypothetical protein